MKSPHTLSSLLAGEPLPAIPRPGPEITNPPENPVRMPSSPDIVPPARSPETPAPEAPPAAPKEPPSVAPPAKNRREGKAA